MKKAGFLMVIALACMIGCSKGPKDMTVKEFSDQQEDKRKEMMKELNGEDYGLIMQATMRYGFKGEKEKFETMTLGDVIEDQRKFNAEKEKEKE